MMAVPTAIGAIAPLAMNRFPALLVGLTLLAIGLPSAQAQGVVNIYSARHYQTDEAFYAIFTRETGIKINRLDGREDELVERIKSEGASGPADILITVDASRLEIADKAGSSSRRSRKRSRRAFRPICARRTGWRSRPGPGSSSTTRRRSTPTGCRPTRTSPIRA